MRAPKLVLGLLVLCVGVPVLAHQEGKKAGSVPEKQGGAASKSSAEIKSNRRLKDLEEKKKAFESVRIQAKERATRAFDVAIAVVKKSTLTPPAKIGRIKELEDARREFVDYGRWPDNDDLLPVAMDYASAVNARYIPLLKAYDSMIAASIKSDAIDAAKKLADEKTQVEKEMPGRAKFREGSLWVGVQSNGKNNVAIDFRVMKLNDPNFEGRIAVNPRVSGHDVLEVRGNVEGVALDFAVSRVVHGKARALRFRGLIVGDKIVGRVGGTDVNGKAVTNRMFMLKNR